MTNLMSMTDQHIYRPFYFTNLFQSFSLSGFRQVAEGKHLLVTLDYV